MDAAGLKSGAALPNLTTLRLHVSLPAAPALVCWGLSTETE